MIGIFIGSLHGGGAERVVLNLVNEFYNRDIPTCLILRHKEGTYLKDLNSNIKVVELDADNPIAIIYRLVKVCRAKGITTLLSVARYNNVLTLIANKFLNIPLVIREANTFDEFFIKGNGLRIVKNKIVFWAMKKIYSKADKIIANSSDTADDILEHTDIQKDKIEIIHNPIVNDKLFKKSKEQVKDQTFLETTRPRIISVGRLEYQKNFKHLIKSFALVKKELPNANLVILGEGSQREELIDLASSMNLSDSVHLLGFVTNPYKYLKAADLFVLSSRFEGFGNVLVEALAVGLSVVSTNCAGGPSEILDNGKFGTLVPINDSAKMAESIIEALNHSCDKNDLIERAKQFSVKSIAEQYIKTI